MDAVETTKPQTAYIEDHEIDSDGRKGDFLALNRVRSNAAQSDVVVPTSKYGGMEIGRGPSFNVDESHLAALGYKQELKRSLSLLGILSLAFSILSTPFSIFTTLIYGLVAGGPVAFLYNWVLVTSLTLCIILSLAEICSVYPTAGSVYFWAAMLSKSEKSGRPLAWITGWLNGIGELCGLAAISFSQAQLIFALASVWHPEFQPTPWQTVLLYWACLALAFVANIPAARGKYINNVATLGAIWTVLAILVVVPTLLGTCTSRRSASYAFGSFTTDFSGFPSVWSWLLASLTPTYGTIAAVNITSLCEEVKSPEREVSRGMWVPVVVNGIVGFLLLVGICFVMPDEVTLLSDPSGQPSVGLFNIVTGSRVACTFLTLFIIVAAQFSGIGSATCMSRFIYGFARDGAIPGSKWLAAIHPTLRVPLNALIAQTIVAALLGLVYIGSSAAFSAFLGSAIACLASAYCVPIGISLSNKRADMKDAPFSLGKFGYALNTISIVWCVVLSAVCCSPLTKMVTPVTMNYASVCLVFFAAISAIWYAVWGRTHFRGPNILAGFH